MLDAKSGVQSKVIPGSRIDWIDGNPQSSDVEIATQFGVCSMLDASKVENGSAFIGF